MRINISERVLKKLAEEHKVDPVEIRHCFENRDGRFLEDTRPEHQTIPPTHWFIAETNRRRKLKIVFINRQVLKGLQIDIRTAYDANSEEIRIYDKYGK